MVITFYGLLIFIYYIPLTTITPISFKIIGNGEIHKITEAGQAI